MMPADADNDTMTKLALENADVQAAIAGKNVVKIICVKGRLVNLVVK
jgi:leucyl-tRNA synthetase